MRTLGAKSPNGWSIHRFVLIWIRPHSLAVIYIVISIATLAAVLDPKIQLSHSKNRVTLGYKVSTPTLISQ